MFDSQKINIITISQQYGSDGYKLAAELAFRLQWQLFGDDIVTQVAQKLGMISQEAEAYHEHTINFVDQALFFLQFSTAEAVEAWASQGIVPQPPQKLERLYYEALQQVLREKVQAGNCVIQGYDAQVLLAHRPDVLHVHVLAPLTQRVYNVMRVEQVCESQARALVRRKEQCVSRYLQVRYHLNAHNPLLYDLAIKCDSLDIDSQVDMIYLALERKASLFSTLNRSTASYVR